MNKLIIIVILGAILYSFLSVNTSDLTIPDEAIRIRVIANSDNEEDLEIKNIVSENLELEIYNLLKDTKGVIEARTIITENLDNISKNVENTLHNNNYIIDYEINFGFNYFPEKNFNGVIYEAGEYESVLVTLGEGNGSNWWCVLFPPLCLVEANESDEIEYKSFVKEILDKYM